jgi:hypothetical protein
VILDRVKDIDLPEKVNNAAIAGINRHFNYLDNGLRPCVDQLRHVTDFKRFFECIPNFKNIKKCQQISLLVVN